MEKVGGRIHAKQMQLNTSPQRVMGERMKNKTAVNGGGGQADTLKTDPDIRAKPLVLRHVFVSRAHAVHRLHEILVVLPPSLSPHDTPPIQKSFAPQTADTPDTKIKLPPNNRLKPGPSSRRLWARRQFSVRVSASFEGEVLVGILRVGSDTVSFTTRCSHLCHR